MMIVLALYKGRGDWKTRRLNFSHVDNIHIVKWLLPMAMSGIVTLQAQEMAVFA